MIKLPPRSARGVLTLPKSRQLSTSFESICLQGMTPAKRAKASAHLAKPLDSSRRRRGPGARR